MAIAHRACSGDDSGILLTDFACSYSVVNHKKRALQERKNFEESVVLSAQRRRCSRKAVSSTWKSKTQACKLVLEEQRNVQRGTLNHRKGLFQAMEEESLGHALEMKEKLEK